MSEKLCVCSESDEFVCPCNLPACGVGGCGVSSSITESGMSAAAADLSDSSGMSAAAAHSPESSDLSAPLPWCSS